MTTYDRPLREYCSSIGILRGVYFLDPSMSCSHLLLVLLLVMSQNSSSSQQLVVSLYFLGRTC